MTRRIFIFSGKAMFFNIAVHILHYYNSKRYNCPPTPIFQELNLAEAVVNRLQTVGLRFCGAADQALPRLRGALPAGTKRVSALLI